MRLKGKRALITGAHGGIGRKVAERFAAEGAELALADAVEGELPVGGAQGYVADLSAVEGCRRLAADVAAGLGDIDLLVNCVGVFNTMPLDDTTEENWDQNVDINLKGVFFLIQAIAPQMRRRGGGRIVNLTSIAATSGFATAHAYCASKGGLLNLTRSLTMELAPDGINVNAIAPGFIRTQMTESQWTDDAFNAGLARMLPTQTGYMEPDAIAAAALFLCSDDAAHMHGHNLVVDDGWLSGVAPTAFG
jgi:NAD(P)-dependent dehydrogenase (short-subunit alcohol dehydrogenase family)